MTPRSGSVVASTGLSRCARFAYAASVALAKEEDNHTYTRLYAEQRQCGTMANKALGLYRQILRAAKLMPTESRRLHIVKKARAEFDKSKQADPQQREFLLALADTHIDNIEAQARHMQQLVARGLLKW